MAMVCIAAVALSAEPTTEPQPLASAASSANGIHDLLNLDVEQLSQVPVASASGAQSFETPVTSVTREPSTVGKSPAAVFVITNEMIRRSGVTSIPEALRMAPGLDVAHVNSNTWAISARGFNNVFSNKLLVLIDGRTVYSPVFSGVYWDVQDVLLEDVDRIEVVRGPGGTLWGANAVNGVINIITKKATETQGTFASAGGGTMERSNGAMRYGGQIGEDGYYRVYGKYFDRSPFYDPNGSPQDGWNQGRVGFRSDWNLDRSKSTTLTVQGDHYVGDSGMTAQFASFAPPFSVTRAGYAHNTGQNVVARLNHARDEDTDWTLQMYYDQFDRGTILNSEKVRTYDVDFQYRFQPVERNHITCGAGYRYINEFCPSEDPLTYSDIPAQQYSYIVSQFVQDEITLSPDSFKFIIGCKLEENPYTGFEYQPSARLLYTPDETHTVWGAVSRAVRMPSIVDRSLFTTTPLGNAPVFLRLLGNEGFQSETLLAYEVGYRTQATERFSWDIATFYNVYGRLASGEFLPMPPGPVVLIPVRFVNDATADTYGAELATHWGVSDHWRLDAQYTFLREFIHGTGTLGNSGDSPRHQFELRSSWDLREGVDFDMTVRYVDCLATVGVPSYITMDLRLAWRPRKHLELAIVGQDLLQSHHYEYSSFQASQVTEVPRSVYGTVTWRY